MADPLRSPFDPSLPELRGMGTAVVDVLSRFVDERYEAPTSHDDGDLGPLLARLQTAPPREGEDLHDLLATVVEAARPGFDTANPGFLGYVPGGGLYAAALGDLLGCVLNRYTGVAAPAPALVALEAGVLRWLCEQFALPAGSQGVLTTGGSMSTLSALVAARTARLDDDVRGARLYATAEVHHCVAKAARIAGLPRDVVHLVATDAHLRADPDALRAAVAEDRAAGLRPFLVVGSAGTVTTGVVDPLHALADVAEQEGLWFHVDGAYGGFFQLTDRGRAALTGIERADTITLDPHKGLFLPYGTGCLLARDAASLRAAHDVQADYLPTPSDDAALPDFSAHTLELTRDARGLRLWLPLHLHGVQAFVDALDEKLDLAQQLHADLSALPGLEVEDGPDLSLVVFRPDEGGDAAADRLLAHLNGTGRLWLSSAPVRGRTALRACILSHRTRPDRLQELVEGVRSFRAS